MRDRALRRRSFNDYARTILGLTFVDRRPNQNRIVLRGISPLAGQSTIALYIDRLSMSSSFNQPDLKLFDAERVATYDFNDRLSGTLGLRAFEQEQRDIAQTTLTDLVRRESRRRAGGPRPQRRHLLPPQPATDGGDHLQAVSAWLGACCA